MLSTTSSILLSTAFTTTYLASIYILPHTRIDSTSNPSITPSSIPPRDRNHPSIIRARLLAVTLSSLASASCLLHLPLSPLSPSLPPPTAMSLLGLPPTPLALLPRLVFLPLGLTATLFAGNFWVVGLRGELPFQRGWSWARIRREMGGWEGVRNYVLVSSSSCARTGGVTAADDEARDR